MDPYGFTEENMHEIKNSNSIQAHKPTANHKVIIDMQTLFKEKMGHDSLTVCIRDIWKNC